jgi:hypothetical protein
MAGLMDEGGIMQISDFAKPKMPVMRLYFYINWAMAVLFFWIFSGTKPNVLGNMEQNFKEAGLKIIKKKTFIGGLYATYLLKKAI